MLRNVILDLLDDIPLAVSVDNLYYQHDGCPAHYQHAVPEHLNSVFPQRSPNFTPLHFFICGLSSNALCIGKNTKLATR